MASAPTPDARKLAAAAAILGRRGGLAKSAKKTLAVRANAKKPRPRHKPPKD